MSGGSLEYLTSLRLGCALLYRRLSPHLRLSPATSPPYLCLRVWSHARDTLRHHSSGMNLVPNRGAPSFYLRGFFTRRESQVALDFDSPHVFVQHKFGSDEW